MAIPSKKDIDKKRVALKGHLKQLDEEGKLKEKKLVSLLRDAIRQVWMRAPHKLAVLEEARVPDMNPNTRTKWLFQCVICKKMFKESDVEVDHIKGNHQFIYLEDFESYCENILMTSKDHLQILCKTCHGIKTYAEGYNLTFEQATQEKEVIAFKNKKAPEQKKILLDLDPKAKTNNEEVRIEEYRRLKL